MPVKKTATPKTTLVTQVTEEPTLQITQEPTLQVTQEPTLQVTQKLKTPTKYNKTVGAHVSNSSYSSTKKYVKHSNPHQQKQSPDGHDTSTPKAGRTLLLKSFNNTPVDSTMLDQLTGLVSTTQTKTSQSYFLTFDTIDNAQTAVNTLQSASPDYKVKFSYYRSFFTISGLTSSHDYNQVKEDFKKYICDNTGANVLFCKFYQKNNEYIGCGDLTVDTLESMNRLLSKDDGIKEYSFGSFKGTFYRYNKKEKDDQQTSHAF